MQLLRAPPAFFQQARTPAWGLGSVLSPLCDSVTGLARGAHEIGKRMLHGERSFIFTRAYLNPQKGVQTLNRLVPMSSQS